MLARLSASRARRVHDAARTYFTDDEIARGEIRGRQLMFADAAFELHRGALTVSRVPDDVWLREHVAQLPADQAIWEVAAFVKVRRLATVDDIVARARSGELYDESYFTQRGGGAPYVGYPLEVNGLIGDVESTAASVLSRHAPASVLDVGCATGGLVKAFADAGLDAHGVDFAQWAYDHRMIDTVVHGSAFDLPWAADRFELVISQDFMEHVDPSELPRAIAEQARVAVPGGAILHLIPFYESDPPEAVDAHLCQATKDWWMRFLAGQPGVEIVREPVEAAPELVDRYVELRVI